MNKILIIVCSLLAAATLFIHCDLPDPIPPSGNISQQNNVFHVQSAYTLNGEQDLYVYTIDSCEYLGTDALNANMAYLTHKGNCKYCLERFNKNVERILNNIRE